MKKLFALLLILLPVLLYGQSTSEPDSGLVIIELKNGETLLGILNSKTDSTFKVLLDIGAMDVNRTSVKSIRQRSRTGNDRFDRPNRYPNRYFLTNSAIPVEQNTSYYQNTYIFFNSLTTSIGPRVSITAGFEYLSLIASEGESPFVFGSVKATVISESQVHFALEATALSLAGESSVFSGSGKLTLGNNDKNVTISTGTFRSPDANRSITFVSGGFQLRTSKSISFLSEGFATPEDWDTTTLIYGIRYHAQRSVISLGLINQKDIRVDFPIGIPYLDVAIRF